MCLWGCCPVSTQVLRHETYVCEVIHWFPGFPFSASLLVSNSRTFSYSLTVSRTWAFPPHSPLLCYPVQAENKGENETDEGDKAQDGDNEKSSEKEQDNEVSEDIKSGNLRKRFRLHYVTLKTGRNVGRLIVSSRFPILICFLMWPSMCSVHFALGQHLC